MHFLAIISQPQLGDVPSPYACLRGGGLSHQASSRENIAPHTHCIRLPRHSRSDTVSLEASAVFGPISCWFFPRRIRRSLSFPQCVYGYDEQGFFLRESANHVNWSSVRSRALNAISRPPRVSGQPIMRRLVL